MFHFTKGKETWIASWKIFCEERRLKTTTCFLSSSESSFSESDASTMHAVIFSFRLNEIQNMEDDEWRENYIEHELKRAISNFLKVDPHDIEVDPYAFFPKFHPKTWEETPSEISSRSKIFQRTSKLKDCRTLVANVAVIHIERSKNTRGLRLFTREVWTADRNLLHILDVE